MPLYMRLLPLAVGLVCASCAGGSIEAFPVPQHRPEDVPMEGARLTEAVTEYISLEGLDVINGQGLGGTRVTDWADVYGIEDGDPPLAECPLAPGAEVEPQYRARYRFDISSRTGIRSLHVLAHWQVAQGESVAGETIWLECRSTGAFERLTQERIATRARMMSRGIGSALTSPP